MRVLSIDPGYERLGVAVLDKADVSPRKETLIYSDCFKTSAKLEFVERLLLIGNEIEEIIKEYSPTSLAMETLFLSTNKTTAMRVAEVRGCILYLASKYALDIVEINPLQIKLAVTGDGKSSKGQMIKMVLLLLGMNKSDPILKKKIVDDEYDAIACGLAFFALGNGSKKLKI